MTLQEATKDRLLEVAEASSIQIGAPSKIKKGELLNLLEEKLGADATITPTQTMKERILQLAAKQLPKVEIERTMREEGYDRIRYAYIFVVLKNEGIQVPKATRKSTKTEETPEVGDVEE